MLKQIRGLFSSDLCIDLGTANTLIFQKGRHIVLNEPSVIAVRESRSRDSGRSIAAIGADAKRMLGRTPGDITTIRPLRDGVVAEFSVTEKMLQHFIRKVHGKRFPIPSPRIVMASPCGATGVERRALLEAAERAGGRDVYLMEEPMAAAIGAGLPVEEASGSMVVDIGGGTSEVAVISLNGIVYARSLRVGGYAFDQAIVNYVRRNHGTAIGDATAERIKHTIGCAYPSTTLQEMSIHGYSLTEGVPRRFTLNSNEVLEALQEPLSRIVMAVVTALEQTPPELGSDLMTQGIVLTGGGALLTGLDRLLSEETQMPVRIAEDPLTCVARGGGSALEQLDRKGIELFATS
jgi:rod shape-determining protein MreB